MPGTGDSRYKRPTCGASPMVSNDSISSSKNRFGEEERFVRHQSSTSRIWASASGVVRTGRFTAVDAIRRRPPPRDEDARLRLSARIRTRLHAGRGVPRRSDHPRRRQQLGRQSSLRARLSARQERAGPSRPALGEDSCTYCTACVASLQGCSATRHRDRSVIGSADRSELTCENSGENLARGVGPSTKEAACNILEGAKEAFQRCARIYRVT